MKIDAHQHFWQIDRGDYGWLTPAMGGLWRDFLPSDLKPLIDARGVSATILVQAAPTVAETDYLLSLAHATPYIAGVVGWIDFEAADAAEMVARLAGDRKLVGLRPMVQDIADPNWLARPALDPVFDALTGADLCFDALVRPHQLPALEERLVRTPDLRVVVDHGAKPDIHGAAFSGWSESMMRIGRTSTAFCKLSGLVTEAGPGWTVDMLRPYVELLLDAFGPRRLMWGSDWPVVTLAATYRAWGQASDALLDGLSRSDREWIEGRTAAAFYRV